MELCKIHCIKSSKPRFRSIKGYLYNAYYDSALPDDLNRSVSIVWKGDMKDLTIKVLVSGDVLTVVEDELHNFKEKNAEAIQELNSAWDRRQVFQLMADIEYFIAHSVAIAAE